MIDQLLGHLVAELCITRLPGTGVESRPVHSRMALAWPAQDAVATEDVLQWNFRSSRMPKRQMRKHPNSNPLRRRVLLAR